MSVEPIAVVCTQDNFANIGILYREESVHYVVWRNGHSDIVKRNVTARGIHLKQISRGKRRIAQELLKMPGAFANLVDILITASTR